MSILELYMANSIDNTASKIREKLNTVRNKRKVSAKRCIWEMMQNAKDVYNPKYGGVSIEFEIVDEHTFVFRHNGLHFTLENVTSLIQQKSSKSSTNEDENVTGMFGTGFISTHLIAEVIDVEGILIDGNDKYRHFNLKLDRSGSSKEELIPKIKAVMTEFAKLDEDPFGVLFPFVTDYENHTEKDYDTSFTYRIESNSQLELALLGINDLVNTLPVTMINLPRVKSVRVINRIEGTNINYTCSREIKDDSVVLSTIINGELSRQYLTYTTDEVSLSIEIKEINGEWYAIKRDDKSPVLLRDFPLIGSHQFYFPYFLNGFKFIPTEPRDDIQLHGDSDDSNSVLNRSIIEKAVDVALLFNQWLINHNIYNRYLLASSRIPKSTESWDEETSEPWIKELQKKWRKELLNQFLLECDDGNYVMSEMLLPDCSKKESRETFWDILCPFVTSKLPKKEHIHEWREIMVEYDSWNCTIKYSIENFLEDLSRKSNISAILELFDDNEKQTFDWLNKIIKFTYEELGSDAFNNYAILPNQNGNFKKCSELLRDNTQPIPAKIKEIYSIAFEENIEDKLLNGLIDLTYVNGIKEYNLSSVVIDLNEFIKNSQNKAKNRLNVSYYLTRIYSGDNSFEHRKTMNYICSGHLSEVNSFINVENLPDEIWDESDKFLLLHLAFWIENNKCTSLSMMRTDYLDCFENINDLDVIDWLNKYLKLCFDIQFTAHLSKYAIFPNQNGDLRKIDELWYDNNIPEEFKDLSEIANTRVQWRASLLDKRIEGYSMHSPKTTSDVYHSITESFDKSSQRLRIAEHALALNYNDNPDVSYMYSILNDIYDEMPVFKEVCNAEGFDWEKFIACAITAVTGEVASKENVHSLSDSLSTDTYIYDTVETIAWVDRFLTFVFNYRGGRYKNIVTELENHGIWINQNEEFCMYSELSKDSGISDKLKDLAAKNPIVDYNYRNILLHNDSVMSHVIDNSKIITQNSVLNKIDESLKQYQADKQNPEFRSLIFGIMELDKQLHISNYMEYYRANKEKLIVGSLGEGDTMNMVAGIIQQGDEKIKIVQEILESNSLEELQTINDVLQGCSINKFDKIKEFIDKLSNETAENYDDKISLTDKDEIDITIVPKIFEIKVEDWIRTDRPVTTEHSQYAGLSLDDIKRYVTEARIRVYKYFKELKEFAGTNYTFDESRIYANTYSQLYGIYGPDGKELNIVAHSYLGPQYRYFDLNWYDWQVLKKENSMLFVLTSNGLKCIPLYALPVRNFNISISNEMSNETRAALLTLATVGKQYAQLSFDFGNNMPQGFKAQGTEVPLQFDYIPEKLNQCITSIKTVCDQYIPKIANLYNFGKNIPLVRSEVAYSVVLKNIDENPVRDMFAAPANDTMAPSVGTTFID